MKNRIPSQTSLHSSPCQPLAKTKTSATPLATRKALGVRQPSAFENTIFSTPKRQNTKSILKTQLSHEGKSYLTPKKNEITGIPVTALKKMKSAVIQDDISVFRSISDTTGFNEGNSNTNTLVGKIKQTDVSISDFLQLADKPKITDEGELSPTNKLDKEEIDEVPEEINDIQMRICIPNFSLFQPEQEGGNTENSFCLDSPFRGAKQNLDLNQEIYEDIKESLFTKEGYLMKKSSSFFGWERQYFKVEASKIYSAPSKELLDSETNIKCLNFLANPCEILEQKGQEFSIAIKGTVVAMTLYLKAGSAEEASEWVEFFQEAFSNVQPQLGKYLSSQEVFHKCDTITEEEFLAGVDTGDILLLKSDHFAAKMQRLFTASDYDHLGMMLRADNDIYICDSSMGNGVQLMNWKDFKREKHYLSYSSIAYRKLKFCDEKLKNTIKAQLWDFVTMNVGKKYELNLKKLFRKASFSQSDMFEIDAGRMSVDLNTTLGDICITQEDVSMKNMRSVNTFKSPSSGVYRDTDEGFFCSELVAAAFKSVGLLDATKSSARYLPVSFSQRKELNLLKGGALSREYDLILLNKE